MVDIKFSELTNKASPATNDIIAITDIDGGTLSKKVTLANLQALIATGDVLKDGTPVNNQIGVWTGDGTIEGTTGLTYTGTDLDITGNITLTGTVDGIDIATDVAANTSKVTNATHTGDVTGSGALTLDKTAISGQALVTAVSGDFLLLGDTSDSDNLKKVNALDFLDGAGTVTSVSAGSGLDFTTVTTTGSVTLGTPGTTTASTTNAVTSTSHTHQLDESGISIAASQVSDFDTEVSNNSSVSANTSKVTNATHTGDVTGSGALTLDKTAITGQAEVTAVGGDFVLISDTGDTGNLKKANIATFLDGTGTVTSVAAGSGLDFTTVTTTGSVTLGTPGTTTSSSTNAVTSTSHTHQLDESGISIAASQVSDFDTEVSNNSSVAANTSKVTNVSTNLSEGTSTTTTVAVNSSDGTNATLVSASTSRAGLLTKAKWDEVVANTSKVTNATHTGDVTGSGALTIVQLSQDLNYNSNGIKITGQTVGGSNGNAVRLSGSNTWSTADASAESTCKTALGIRISATDVLMHGVYTTTSLTAGSLYYVSETAGAITTTAPTTSLSIVRPVAYALTTTELYVFPAGAWVENA